MVEEEVVEVVEDVDAKHNKDVPGPTAATLGVTDGVGC